MELPLKVPQDCRDWHAGGHHSGVRVRVGMGLLSQSISPQTELAEHLYVYRSALLTRDLLPRRVQSQ